MGEILSRRPGHGRPANVNLFHRLANGIREVTFHHWRGTVSGDCGDKWVQVRDNQVDRHNPVFRKRREVSGEVSTGKDAGMDSRMEGLDPSAKDFRKASYISDRNRRNTGFVQSCVRLPGADKLPTEIMQTLRKLRQTGLVPHA
jgi:hypothetical protein